MLMDMGDRRSENGSILRWEVEDLASAAAFKMVRCLSDEAYYRRLIVLLPRKKVDLLFAKYFKEQIYPCIAELVILRWYKRRGISIDIKCVPCKRAPWFPLLEEIWDDPEVPVVAVSEKWITRFKDGMKNRIKRLLTESALPIGNSLNRGLLVDLLLNRRVKKGNGRVSFGNRIPVWKAAVGVHYGEGVDVRKRSEIFWFPHSRINPAQVLIYIDQMDSTTNGPVSGETIAMIEEMGMSWISLKKGCVSAKDDHFWHQSGAAGSWDTLIHTEDNAEDNSRVACWLRDFSEGLLERVQYWKTFFDAFGIRINVDAQESGIENIIRNIAVDLIGGVCVGTERSLIRNMPKGDFMGHYPCHIYFVWNDGSARSLAENENCIEAYVVSGHAPGPACGPAVSHDDNKTRQRKNSKMVIGLFDNVSSSNDGPCKQKIYTPHLDEFYRAFLQWAIEEEEVTILIKSKKPSILKGMPEIQDLIRQGERRGRCKVYSNELGIRPSDLAPEIDLAMTVGLTFPATFVELALYGCRVVHYDVTNIRPFEQELYDWGYEKVIFNDIDRLLATCKRYKEDPEIEPDLGDFSQHVHELDPFSDGRAGERVGNYMRWLLAGFDKGKNRDEAIENANQIYCRIWGKDKVISNSENPAGKEMSA